MPIIDRIAKFFCSLRLTVALLIAGAVLVFVGTLAQVHEGLFAAQVRYFKSWYIWKPTIGDNVWPILLPGGYLIGSLLLMNLVAAHIKRFKFKAEKFSIQLIHGGVVLLLLGQLLTDALSQESSMRLFEGTSSNYSEDFRANELVLTDTSDATSDQVVSIPESLVTRKEELHNPALPVTVRVKDYWPNCDVSSKPPFGAIPAPADHGLFQGLAVLPMGESEPASEQTRPAVLVEIISDKGSIGTFLVPKPTQQEQSEGQQAFNAAGRAWWIYMVYAPFLGGNLLAVSHVGDMMGDSMVTFSEDELQGKGELKREGLPFRLRIKGYWPRCQLYRTPGTNSIYPGATEGEFAGGFLNPKPLVTDTDHRNIPAALVELSNAKGSLGTWLLSTFPENPPEMLRIGGKSYRMAFQFKRYYQPYKIGLLKFSHDRYKGTDLPKNFASRLRVINPQTHEDRQVDIRMNSPLRYQGTTYYQAGFDQFRPDVTILEVVTNPSWLTPYFACLIVGMGLIMQFMSHLIGFAMKRRTQ